MTLLCGWDDPHQDQANIGWLRGLWDRLSPHLPSVVYVNELYEEGADRVRAAYGPAYQRLAQLKQKYDPQNLFCLNQNILPA